MRRSSVRVVFACEVKRVTDGTNDWLHIDVQGDGFLYNMVRNIVGTLVDIGHGRWAPDQMSEILAAKNRCAAGQLAPASGLCLQWISYQELEDRS